MAKRDKTPSVSDLQIVQRFVEEGRAGKTSLAAFGQKVGLSRDAVATLFERVDEWAGCRMCMPVEIAQGYNYRRTGIPSEAAEAIGGAAEILDKLVRLSGQAFTDSDNEWISPAWMLRLKDDILDLIDERVDVARGRPFAKLVPRRRGQVEEM